jgi:RNA polymerase sigma-70 factor (ECF subfamily)
MDPLTASFDRWRQHGDLAALDAVFDALAPRLLPIALHLCGNAADAEDALQQTFLLAMDKAAAFDPNQRLEPWLTGILQNVVRNQSRRQQRHRNDPLPEIASSELGPLDRAEREELAARLRTHVDALPADQRQVLRLVLQHGMSAVAIAEVLEVPPGTVRMRMHRGIDALRRVLPAGLTLLLTTSLATRGLAAVKREVLAAGAAKSAAAAAVTLSGAKGSAIVLGGALVTKKLSALVLFFVVGVLSTLWWFGGAPSLAPTDGVPLPPVASQGTADATTKSAAPLAANATDETSRKAATPAPAEPAEPGPTEIWGRVIDSTTKQPVRAASIDLLCRDADSFWCLDLDYGERTATLAHTTSDDEGRFRFSVRRATPHRLLVQAAGYPPKTMRACSGGSLVTIEMARGSVLTGVVRCEGTPVGGASIRIAVPGDSSALANEATDASGAFRFVGLQSGAFLLQVSGDRFIEKWSLVTIADNGQQHLEIDVKPGEVLRGRVVDAVTGQPIKGARVSESWSMRRMVRTGNDGRFAIAGLLADRDLLCHVRADGYASAEEVVGTKIDAELVLRLARGGGIRGRIVGTDGLGIRSAYVAVCASAMKVAGLQECDWIRARVEADGRFVATGIRSNQHYWLMARAQGYGMRTYALPRVLGNDEQQDVGDVVLHPGGVIEGSVVDDQGHPMVGAEVRIEGANHDARAWLTSASEVSEVAQFRDRRTRTDSKGRFRLPDLTGGSWRVSFRPEGSDRALTQDVVLAEGEVREGVRFVLTVGLTIAGAIFSVDGAPLTDVIYLDASPEGKTDTGPYSTRADSDGRFRFQNIKPGTYTIAMATRIQGQVMTPVFHVAAGKTDLRIVLETPAYIRGKVVNAAGQPVRANLYAQFDGVLGKFATSPNEADGTFRLEVPATFRGKVRALPADLGPGGAEVDGVTAGTTNLLLTMRGLF